eukprot:TRINITY_DN6418_c0_g1_i1.p1 TRINITY_DN6418_c0_g1~~TRINITY_DN6418_c0_g1_i1.p1  ORF type:complete len:768 (+),score=204.30 TRINITY_DN6418_c0_g1_i1:34-2337(+)
MEYFDGINARRSRYELDNELSQDFGAGFQFSEDAEALQSILSNTGISAAQRQAMHQEALGMNPNSNNSGGEKFEFFQGQNGHVFFRRRKLNNLTMEANSRPLAENRPFADLPVAATADVTGSGSKYRPVRFRGGKKGSTETGSRKENWNPNLMMSEKKTKGPEMFVAPHRQSISERKPVRRRSQLPSQQTSSEEGGRGHARKGLHFDKGDDIFKKPFTPLADRGTTTTGALGAEKKFPLEPLCRLDRESMKLLPRDSLAWINHLPRDSATFLELERLMHDKDKDLLKEDDTSSFEAMELRLKTPRRPQNVQKTKLEDVEKVEDGKDPSEADIEEEINEEVCTPDRERFKVMLTLTPKFYKEDKDDEESNKKEFVPKSDLIKGDLLEDFENMPTNAKLATPTIKSKSMTNLTEEKAQEAEPKEVHKSVSEERIGVGEEVSSLVSLDELASALHEMENLRQQQEELEKMQEELFQKIRERKQSFKDLWGVSPMSINKTRTIITKPAPITTETTPEVTRAQSPKSSITNKISQFDLNSRSFDDDSLNDTVENKNDSLLNTPSLQGLRPLSDTPDIENDATTSSVENENQGGLMNTEMKKVRFNSGENKAKYLTPDSEVTFKLKDCTNTQPENPLTSLAAPMVEVTPVVKETHNKYNRRSLNSQSFMSLKSSFAFLQTPGGGNKHQSVKEQNVPSNSQGEPTVVSKGLPTPMALKSLSARVKEEYALLYADDDTGDADSAADGSEQDDSTETLSQEEPTVVDCNIMKKLKF